MFTHNASACTKTSDVTQVQLQGINFNLAYFGLLNPRWRHASFACAWACLSRELRTFSKTLRQRQREQQRFKGQTIRKVMGGEGFSAYTNFFFRPLLVQEFFLQVKPSARIFFLSDKYCFVCHLLIKTNYFTKELLYFVGFNNNWRPFFNNYIKDLKSNVMYCLLFSDCFLFTIHFLTAIHIQCFINVSVFYIKISTK